MRIAVVTRSLPVHGGGGMERLTEDLMTCWAESGHDVICYTTPLPTRSPAVDSGRVREVAGRSGRYSRRWRRGLRSAVRPEEHDVILGVSSGAASLAGRTGRTPVVMQAHGTALAELRTKLSAPSARALAGAVKNSGDLIADLRTYRRYDGIVAIGRGVADDLLATPRAGRPKDVEVIVNGVPGAGGDSTSRAVDGVPQIVFVGRLKREKGVDLLLEAAKQQRWHLSIAGDGPERENLRRLADEFGYGHRVDFLGAVDRDRVSELMGRADVVVIPSRRREGLPLVALEALVSGSRLVVTRPAARSIPAGYGCVITTDATADALRAAVGAALARPRPAPEPAFRIEECAATYIDYFERLRGAGRLG